MVDLTPTIVAKSDQLNATDLLGGPVTIKITKVERHNTKDQPVSVHYEGEDGRPYKPCLSMRRVLVFAWGPEGDDYIGREMTLFCDPAVRWADEEVGGIRISHMSHLKNEISVALTETRRKRKPYIVLPMGQSDRQEGSVDAVARFVAAFVKKVNATETMAKLREYVESKDDQLNRVSDQDEKLYQRCLDAIEAKKKAFAPRDESDGQDDDDRF